MWAFPWPWIPATPTRIASLAPSTLAPRPGVADRHVCPAASGQAVVPLPLVRVDRRGIGRICCIQGRSRYLPESARSVLRHGLQEGARLEDQAAAKDLRNRACV